MLWGVGRSVKRYSLFDDTVNFAAHMKSTSEVRRIQVREAQNNLFPSNLIERQVTKRHQERVTASVALEQGSSQITTGFQT